MNSSGSSSQESARLEALTRYQILDTAAEASFDNLTRLAAAICEAPISLVSLVDEDRQWFKSRHGLDATQTPREQAFCAHALHGEDVLVVEDACEDPRFVDNPLVTGDPGIRFYAGAPLRVEGLHSLGTLCVIDRVPRSLSADQLHALTILRDAVVSHLELNRAASELKAMQSLLPVCAWCRSVKRDDSAGGHWQPLHEYVAEMTPVSHSICPRCSASVERATQDKS